MVTHKNDSIKWLIRLIVIVASVAIVIILIVHNSVPSETPASIDSSSASSQTVERPVSTSDSFAEEESQSSPSVLSQPTEPASSQPDSTSQPSVTSQPDTASQSTVFAPRTVEAKCYHQENGVCLDDYEDEAYSAGLYDHSYGYYGTSLDYPDDCNAICQESLEDAYEEGWYDAGY
ncbi:hypothetical protein IKG60_00840 [Candidatus Saccharibacteria bacterium]|nr:hypothetical protein [Candidatus Saccharibacteria bacterium]